MKMSNWFAGMALLSLAAVAHAHTHLKSAVPAKDSTVKTSPEQLTLTFSSAARVTALTIQKDGGPEQAISALPTAAATVVTVPAPKLSPGKYTVSWRIMGADSHAMSGKFSFTVAGADAAASTAAAHDKH